MLHVSLQRARRRWSLSNPSDAPSHLRPTSTLPASWVDAPSMPTPPPEEPTRRARRRSRAPRAPRLSAKSAIVPAAAPLAPLQAALPVRFGARDWQLAYSTMRDGVSLQTFYARLTGADPVVVLVRDGGGAVFGCYTSVPWRAARQYYGNGEGFVFSVLPELKVYPWTKANSFFQLGTSDSIAMGGGGKFAIFLDSMFERGSSGPCATYGSPCLASSDQFDIVVLEAYKLVSPLRLVVDGS